MGKIKKIQNDCHRATYLIEKGQQTPLSIGERIELVIHLAGCGICRLYKRQSRWISQALRGLFHASAGHGASLDEDVKREMQEKINERLP